MAITTQNAALTIHAMGAPLYFCTISLVYFSRFRYTNPLQTALIFTGFVMFLDFFLVAIIILRSLEMFTSLIGTWIPFALIFLSTYVTGLVVTHRESRGIDHGHQTNSNV